nr:RNA-directed DNA polymerase, eukaryota [Tanacetum cinerariifolium]
MREVLGFKPCRGGFPSGAKKEWGLSPKAKVRVLHTAHLDVTMVRVSTMERVFLVLILDMHPSCTLYAHGGSPALTPLESAYTRIRPSGSQRLDGHVGSYANLVKGVSSGVPGSVISPAPALVLDGSCLVDRDLSKHVMGKAEPKENLMNHTGVKLWFHIVQDVVNDFVSKERIVWVDIEGIPLNAWSRETFVKIGKIWGDTLDLEDNSDSSFGRKRLCIKTKHAVSILESFKIIVRGKVYMVRAKELFTWNPSFLTHKEREYSSEDESVHASKNFPHFSDEESDDDNASDVNGVPETDFGTSIEERDKQHSDDPFEIYHLLKKKNYGKNCDSCPSLSHPPDFTSAVSEKQDDNATVIGDTDSKVVKEHSESLNAKVMNNSQEVSVKVNNESAGQSVIKNWGSVLGVLEGCIRVGQAMGYTMEGCLGDKTKKEWIKALANTHKLNFLVIQETKMSRVSHMDVKFLWGNSNYDYVYSDSLGCSGGRWNGEAIIMGDFNEVRSSDERRGSCFNPYSARCFDRFISSSSLVNVNFEGYAFTWSHPSTSKMSKLDPFLVSGGLFKLFPSILALCLDRHLSDHRSILLREMKLDFFPTPFCFYHSWFDIVGFDDMVTNVWRSFSHSDKNGMIRFKKKLQDLKGMIDKDMDRGVVSEASILRRLHLKRKLLSITKREALDCMQKSKVKWAVEGDENSKFFHDLGEIKDAFFQHFEAQFKEPATHRLKHNFQFLKKLLQYQADDLERRECIGPDFCELVEYFFVGGSFSKGCNSSFVTLIPKVIDAKVVNDFRPITLIGCVYKVITKVLANRLVSVILDLVSDTQSAFVSRRQILDDPFILDEILNWCKRKKKQAMFFKVDFAKAYDSVRWDYLLDVLEAFGFGAIWCKWIRGTFSFAKASILVNGSPSKEFSFHRGLKQ